jgi:GH25 family lysozyme M1 (1,4-beta-N-acetylmuramidase)
MLGFFRRSRRFSLPFALVGLTVLTSAGALPVDAASHKPPPKQRNTEGIDVSHWQGAINWSQVYAAGKRFAFVKVTESTTFLDNKYATNHAAARAAGIVVGGYHYAQPSATPGDAVAEADWFVTNLALLPGDMRPALDLETRNGLDVPTMQQWVRDFLGEVYRLTGKHATIYVSRAFWRDSVGDIPEAALDGSALWLSKWNVTDPSPYVPASNWGGNGWSFWQYSGTGTVRGISGNVDLDRLNGTDLTPFL